MIWVGKVDWIYVLFDDEVFSPKWTVCTDEWDDGEPLCDAGAPPAGRYQPQRGFGLVWCEQPGVCDRLGWAVNQESGYETAVQGTSDPKYSDSYIRALDGNVWCLKPESSGWEKIIVDWWQWTVGSGQSSGLNCFGVVLQGLRCGKCILA